MEKAIELARTIGDDKDRAAALIALGKHASEAMRLPVLVEVFAWALEAGGETFHESQLPEIVSELVTFPKPVLQPLWIATVGTLATLTRPQLLDNLRYLSPILARVGGAKTMQATFRALRDTARSWEE